MENGTQHPKSHVVVGYIRVSQVAGRAGASFISPDVQREQVERWATYAGVEIASWQTDLDQSGGSQDRPGLREAMRLIESGAVGGIACAKLDRFARNMAGAWQDLDAIKRCGARLVCVAEGIDTGASNAFATFSLNMLLAIATLERDRLTEGWQESRARATERGVSIALAPLGYVRGDDGRLIVDEATAPIVREAFRLAAASGPHAALDHLRVHAPDREWPDLSTVRRFLARRVFIGELRSGEFVQTDAHKRLVDIATWHAAQSTGRASPWRRPSADYPLSGLVTCSSCGATLKGNRSGKPVNGAPKRRYSCSARGVCAAPVSIDAETLEIAIFDAYRRVLAGAAEHHGDVVIPGRTPPLDDLRIALDTAQRRLDEVLAPEVQEDAGPAYGALLRMRNADVETAALELGRAEAGAEDVTVTPTMRLEAWDAASTSERRARILSWASWETITLARGRKLTIGKTTISL